MQNKKVLILEFNADLADMLKYIIEGMGFDAYLGSHLDPLKDIINVKPDLLVVHEWTTRDSQGKANDLLLGNLQTPYIPILLLSVIPKNSYKEFYKIAATISKPFDIEELEEKVHQLIKTSVR